MMTVAPIGLATVLMVRVILSPTAIGEIDSTMPILFFLIRTRASNEMISKNSSKKSTFSSKMTTADHVESTDLSGSSVSFHPSLVISEMDTAISLVLAPIPQSSSGNGTYGFVVVVVTPVPSVVVVVIVVVAATMDTNLNHHNHQIMNILNY